MNDNQEASREWQAVNSEMRHSFGLLTTASQTRHERLVRLGDQFCKVLSAECRWSYRALELAL